MYGNSLIGRMGTDLMNGLREMYPDNRILLYCNISTYLNIVVPFGVPVMDGLWIATPDQVPHMPWVFWQYTSTPVDTNRSVFDSVESLREWAGMGDDVANVTAEEIVKAFMQYRIEGVKVGSVAGEGEEQQTWSTTVENAIGSLWGQVFNATGEYGPSLAGGLESVIDDIGVVHSAVLALGDSPELTRLFERLVVALERVVGER